MGWPVVRYKNQLFIIVGLIFLMVFSGCDGRTAGKVVAYVSEDRVFSEPILMDFERDTGIEIKAVYDTEETKSTGVMNRLIAERDNPQADVYWANEPIRAVVLKRKGISESYLSPNAAGIPSVFKDREGYWTGFSARARVLIVSGEGGAPKSIFAYIDKEWKNKSVIANPLFGTTTSWVSALFSIWGDVKAKDFMEGMKANGAKVAASNGESTALVINKEFVFSLVDSDDAANAIREGKPVKQIYPDQEEGGIGCLVLPNAAVLIKGGPDPENGKKLMDYLLSTETERKLAFANCAQIPLHKGVEMPSGVGNMEKIRVMNVDYESVMEKMLEIQPYLKKWAGY